LQLKSTWKQERTQKSIWVRPTNPFVIEMGPTKHIFSRCMALLAPSGYNTTLPGNQFTAVLLSKVNLEGGIKPPLCL